MHVVKLPKVNEAIVNKKTVVESYLQSQSTFPIMLTHGSGDTWGYYYRFIPELVPGLYEGIEIEQPVNLVADCEQKFKELHYAIDIDTSEPRLPHISKPDKFILSWLILWRKVFICHEAVEHQYRLDQLFEVLGMYQRKDLRHLVELYKELIEVCYTFGSARLAVKFYENINSIAVKGSSAVMDTFMLAIMSGENSMPLHSVGYHANGHTESTIEETKFKPASSEGTPNIVTNDPIPYMDYQTYFKSCLHPFKQRTFLLERLGEVVAEEIKIAYVPEKCPKCGYLPNVIKFV